jgi:hypothetical protein
LKIMSLTHAAAAAAPPTPAAAPLPPVLKWSIADAWTWLGHAWRTLIHEPYLGVIFLLLAAALLIRAVHKLMS